MKKTFFYIALLVTLVKVTSAQTSIGLSQKDILRMREKNTDFTGLSSIMTQLSFINLTTSTGEDDITANIGFKYKTNNVFNLQINTPFNGTQRAEAVNVNGLAGSSGVSFGFQHYFNKSMSVFINGDSLVKYMELIGKARKPDCCDEAVALPTKYSDLTDEEKVKLEQLLTYKKFVPFIGLKAKAAKKDFDFFTDTTLQNTDSREVYEYEGKLILGAQLTNHSSFALSLTWQEYHDPGDAGTFNTPTSNTSVSRQQELYPSPPVLKNKVNVQIEYRKILLQGRLAIQPIAVADLTNNVVDARLQFYFLNLKEDDKFKGLNGGMFMGYRTGKDFEIGLKKESFLVGIFFSPVFNITKY